MLTTASAVGARAASAQAVIAPSAAVAAAPGTLTTRWEYARYEGQGDVDGPRIWATAVSEIRGKHWAQFAARLGASPFPAYARTEPAFFTWLGAQGWELVGCTRATEVVGLLGDRAMVTQCQFRRAVAAGTSTPQPAADTAPARVVPASSGSPTTP